MHEGKLEGSDPVFIRQSASGLSAEKNVHILPVMTTVAIALKDEDQDFIQEAVNSGRFFSESEVVAEALSGLKVREAIHRGHMEELREQVRIGIDQADRGFSTRFDGILDMRMDKKKKQTAKDIINEIINQP